MPAVSFERGTLLHDIPARNLSGSEVQVSDFRGKRNVALIFPGQGSEGLVDALATRAEELVTEESVVLLASDAAARDRYGAPGSAMFIADRYGEIFFCAREPEPFPDAAEVLKWLEFINAQCPE